jgi:hypothetical protein
LQGARSAKLLGKTPVDVEGLLVVSDGDSRVTQLAGDVPEPVSRLSRKVGFMNDSG